MNQEGATKCLNKKLCRN